MELKRLVKRSEGENSRPKLSPPDVEGTGSLSEDGLQPPTEGSDDEGNGVDMGRKDWRKRRNRRHVR